MPRLTLTPTLLSSSCHPIDAGSLETPHARSRTDEPSIAGRTIRRRNFFPPPPAGLAAARGQERGHVDAHRLLTACRRGLSD